MGDRIVAHRKVALSFLVVTALVRPMMLASTVELPLPMLLVPNLGA